MCRRITGYILYRCNLNLNKKIQKAASKAGKEETVKKYVVMREMVTTVFTAVRDEVKDDMSSKEIEFYQNSAYALTNPSDDSSYSLRNSTPNSCIALMHTDMTKPLSRTQRRIY